MISKSCQSTLPFELILTVVDAGMSVHIEDEDKKNASDEEDELFILFKYGISY